MNRDLSRWTSTRAAADIVFCTREAIEKYHAEQQCVAFVWPEEGEFQSDGSFVFNEKHRPPYFEVYQPLLVDIVSLNLLKRLYDSREDKVNKQGELQKSVFDRRVKESRAYFGLF